MVILSSLKTSDLPERAQILPSAWQMKRKRRIETDEGYTWKARCNIDGSKQFQNIDYEQTHSPVAGWASIRMILIKAMISRYHSRQIDYVLAYTQVEIERLLYMEIPKVLEVDGDPGYYVLECSE
jgi:Reverse transcriptase (RNA-dependent DNA polymerase)